MRAAIYARVSTAAQKTDLQLDECRRFCASQAWQVVEYHEKQSALKQRPVLAQLMDDARLRKFDVVVVWKLDRMARSMKQFVDLVLELTRYNVRFLSVTQRMIDTDQRDPMGVFIRDLFAALAQFERGIIVERVKAGVAAARARGVHCGRPQKIYARDQAIEMRRAGASWRAIAAAVGVDQRSIRRLLATAPPPPPPPPVAKVPKKSPPAVKQTKR